jgi:mannose-6-phosphate isomerase-like protein (cupin superfamily)
VGVGGGWVCAGRRVCVCGKESVCVREGECVCAGRRVCVCGKESVCVREGECVRACRKCALDTVCAIVTIVI